MRCAAPSLFVKIFSTDTAPLPAGFGNGAGFGNDGGAAATATPRILLTVG